MLCDCLLSNIDKTTDISQLSRVLNTVRNLIHFEKAEILLAPIKKPTRFFNQLESKESKLSNKLDMAKSIKVTTTGIDHHIDIEKSICNNPVFGIVFNTLDRYFWRRKDLINNKAFVESLGDDAIISGLSIPYLQGVNNICVFNYYFGKEIPPSMIIEYIWISHILNTKIMALNQKGKAVKRKEKPDVLTNREEQIVQLMCTGKSSKEIAIALVIGASMVQRHIDNARRKLKCDNRYELSYRYTQYVKDKAKAEKPAQRQFKFEISTEDNEMKWQ